MPRPGFYNDNEYRAYPFVYGAERERTLPLLPDSLIVDVGIIMGLDADFDFATNSVWLSSIRRNGATLTFEFATDAAGGVGAPLRFTRSTTADTWQTEFAASVTADLTDAPCADEPIWEGFLTTGQLASYAAGLGTTATVTFAKNQHRLEPGRIQNLAKSYLRSISVGNFARTNIPACGTVNTTSRPVVLHTHCMRGDIRFKEGYHCAITQTDRAKEISISAGLTSGMAADSALCEAGSEIPLFDGESAPVGSKFYGGGPACNELITTINGIGGRTLSIVGGSGVQVGTEPNKITVALDTNSQNNCATGTTP
jgi:hypothetical protein